MKQKCKKNKLNYVESADYTVECNDCSSDFRLKMVDYLTQKNV